MEGPSEAEVRAVVGPSADFYLRNWQTTERRGFNWTAFLLSGLWLPYRKMYRETAILCSAIIAESVAEELLFVGWLGWPETPRALDRGVTVAICWLCGHFGNAWYLAHVKRVVSAARAEIPDEAPRLMSLARRGGTTVLGAVCAFALFMMAIFTAFALLAEVMAPG